MAGRRFKWLRRIALGVIAVLVTTSLALGWLLGTSSGARFAASQLAKVVPGRLTIGDIDGALLRGVELSGVRYEHPALSVSAGRLALDVGPGVLVNYRRIDVHHLRLADVDVVYAATPADPAPAQPPQIVVPAFEAPSLPVTIVVDELTIDRARIRSSDGAVDQSIDRLALVGRYGGRDIELTALSLDSPMLVLDGAASATLDAALPLELSIDWRLPSAEPAANGKLDVSGDRSGYAVDHRLASPEVVSTRGDVSLPVGAPIEFSLRNRVEAMDLAAAGRPIRLRDAEAWLAGRIDDWQLEANASVGVADAAPADVALTAAGNLADIAQSTVSVARDGETQAELNGSLTGWPQARWQADARLNGFDLAAYLPSAPSGLSGRIESTGQLGDALQALVRFDALQGELAGHRAELSGVAAWRQGAVRAEGLVLSLGRNTLSADGRIEPSGQGTLDITLDANDLSQIDARFAGEFAASGQLTGSLSTARAELDIASEALTALGVSATDLDGKLSVGIAVSAPLAIDLAAARLVVAGQSIDDLSLRVDGEREDHALRLEATVSPLQRVRLAAEGGYRDAAWSGALTALELTFARTGDGAQTVLEAEGPAALTIARDRQSLSELCLSDDDDTSLCVLASATSSAVELDARWSGIVLAEWIPAQDAALLIDGVAQGSVTLSGPRDALAGRAEATVAGLEVRSQDRTELAPLDFSEAALTAELQGRALSSDVNLVLTDGGAFRSRLRFADAYAEDSAVDGRLELRLPALERLNPVLSLFQLEGGALDVTSTIRGSRRSPVVDTDARVSSLNADVPSLGILLEDIELSATSDVERLQFSGSGRSGEGQFQIGGQASLDPRSGFATEAKIDAQSVTFLALPDLRAVASVDVAIEADRYGQRITGSVFVDEADLRVRELPADAVQVSDDQRYSYEPRRDPAAAGGRIQRIDVEIGLGDAVNLDAFGLQTRLTGELDVLQDPGAERVRGSGIVDLEDATYRAYGQTLQVTRGRLVFNGPLDSPVLDVRAERSVDGTDVGIDISGTPGALSSSLFSSPSLPEAEILSLLLTGRSLSGSGADDAALANAALTLGLKRAFGISAGLRDRVGLDTLTVEGSGGDGRLLAGKQLSESLYLEYAYGVFDRVSRVLLRLQLSERLALESTSGETQSVDLVYRVGSR